MTDDGYVLRNPVYSWMAGFCSGLWHTEKQRQKQKSGKPMSICKACGASITWKRISGKWSCLNPDGVDHWDLCSKLKFERIKATGKYFDVGDKGYFTDLKPSGVQYTEQHSQIMQGDLYKPSGDCAGCCPPWEVCDWPCPDSLGLAL